MHACGCVSITVRNPRVPLISEIQTLEAVDGGRLIVLE